MDNGDKKVRFLTVRVSEIQYQWLQTVAKAQGRTVSGFVRFLIGSLAASSASDDTVP